MSQIMVYWIKKGCYYTTSIFCNLYHYFLCGMLIISKYWIFHFGSVFLIIIISLEKPEHFCFLSVFISHSCSPNQKGENVLKEELTFECICVFCWLLWNFFFLMRQPQTFFYTYVKLWKAIASSSKNLKYGRLSKTPNHIWRCSVIES